MNFNDPKILETAGRLGISRFDLLGRVYAVTQWVRENPDDSKLGELAELMFADWGAAAVATTPARTVTGQPNKESTGLTVTQLSAETQKQIQERYGAGGLSHTDIMNEFGLTRCAAQTLCRGLSKPRGKPTTRNDLKPLTAEQVEQTKAFMEGRPV